VSIPAQASRGRLAGEARRESLVDAAAELINEDSIDEVSMETVAQRAGVSRALVYKHFSNRGEILAAVYRREAALLHDQMARQVAASASVEDMFRTLIRSSMRATRERGPLFASLRSAGAWSRQVGREQRSRDVDTSRAFARRAIRELDLDPRTAKPAISLLLGLVDQVLAQFRANPTPANQELLEATYMTIVNSTLGALARSNARREAR
jgi:AcrR family transcriptional regulator